MTTEESIDNILEKCIRFVEAYAPTEKLSVPDKKASDEAKQALLKVMLDIVGKDETRADTLRLQPTTAVFERNQLRAELRKKIEDMR